MDWSDLKKELDCWSQQNAVAQLWWRDDDAHSLTPQLHSLYELCERHHIPVALAVIPNKIEMSLVDFYRTSPLLRVFQHGFDHVNHGKGSGRAGELEDHRSQKDVYQDLAQGRRQLKEHFPDSLDVLVPPWNKIAEEYIKDLASLGFCGLSRFANQERSTTKELTELNCHVDIIKWKKPPYFRGTKKCLTEIIEHLQSKRLASANSHVPTGILSHHLDHDLDCFDFLDQLMMETTRHPACQWLDPKELFK